MIYSILMLIILINLIAAQNNSTEPAVFFNTYLDEMNPSSFYPPKTDFGGQDPFKYPFSFAHTSRFDAGWTRQVTVLSLPVAKKMSGVQMRLIKGGIREMHWHRSSEWAYVIDGTCRITILTPGGQSFVDDIDADDLWLFPGGFPHSIQGVGENGCFFLLVFNVGDFSEFSTFLLTDWINHTPKEVLSKNFATPESTFANVPKPYLYIFPGTFNSLEEARSQAYMVTGETPEAYTFHTNRMQPNVTRAGGEARIIDRNNFPVSDIAAAIITLKPGGLRELHWHPNADEWQYYVKGKARMTVFDGSGLARTMDFSAGDVGYVPQTVPHYFENTGDEDVLVLEVFPTPYFQDISLALWLAHTPPLLVNQHIRTGEAFIDSIPKTEATLVPWGTQNPAPENLPMESEPMANPLAENWPSNNWPTESFPTQEPLAENLPSNNWPLDNIPTDDQFV